jgi:hypothetical protein
MVTAKRGARKFLKPFKRHLRGSPHDASQPRPTPPRKLAHGECLAAHEPAAGATARAALTAAAHCVTPTTKGARSAPGP